MGQGRAGEAAPASPGEEELHSGPHTPRHQPEHPKAIQSPELLMAMDATL